MTGYDVIKTARKNGKPLTVEDLTMAIEDQSEILGAAAVKIAEVEATVYAMSKGETFVEDADKVLAEAIAEFTHERQRLAKLFRWRMNVSAGKLDGGE